MIWSFCKRCRKLTKHFKRKISLVEQNNRKDKTLEHFMPSVKWYCSRCLEKPKNKLSMRFKTRLKAPKNRFKQTELGDYITIHEL